MDEQPNYHPAFVPSAHPSEAFPTSINVPGQTPQVIPVKQVSPVQQNPYYQNQVSYVPTESQYTPTPGVPVRRGSGESAIMVWLLGGCGLIAVLFTILCVFFIKSIGDSDLMKNQSGIAVARRNLVEIRTTLNQYVKDHDGKYPQSLQEVVDPAYLSYSSGSTGNTVQVSYQLPEQNDTPDTAVAGFYVGEMTMNVGQKVEQRTYLRLLKDGTIVQEQITRTPLPGQ